MNKNVIIGIVAIIAIVLILIATGAYSPASVELDNNDFVTPTTSIFQSEQQPLSPTPSPADQEMMTLSVYFNNLQRNEDCDQVFPVQREIFRTQTPAQTSIQLLLQGPTDQEQEQGFTSNISDNAELNSIRIENGIIYVDFSEELDAAGSCAVLAIRAQITQTLLQFPTVNQVIISIEGDSEEILQP